MNDQHQRKNDVIKIALLSSYTANNLIPFIENALGEEGLHCMVKIGAFDQYIQELMDSSSWLHSFDPSIILITLSSRTVFPNLEYTLLDMKQKDIDTLVDEKMLFLSQAIGSYKGKATLILTNLEYPLCSPYGIQETNGTIGMHYAIERWNSSLKELRKDHKNAIILDFERMCSIVGKTKVTDEKMYYLGKILLTNDAAKVFASEFVKYVCAIYGQRKKCILVDLDNTLWKGVIGEDGQSGIIIDDSNVGSMYRDVQKVLLNYKKAGVLLGIVSKNNQEDVKGAFKKEGMVLKEDDFAAIRINWEPKSKNILSIAKELNIGLDSLVFLDDNPAERMEVAANAPNVEVVEFPEDIAELPAVLKSLPYFETLAITDEDRQRHDLYRQEKKRVALKASSVEDYRAQLGTVICVKRNDKASLERITQLINKTNQFNLRTKRYTADEAIRMMDSNESMVLSMHVADKFGELGLTGVIIVRKVASSSFFIDTFLMSCRIMGRGIEQQFFAEMVKLLPKDVESILAEYIPTKKNEVVEKLYEQLGFSVIKSDGGVKTYSLKLEQGDINDVPYIKVKNNER